jgi:hypothetical protein
VGGDRNHFVDCGGADGFHGCELRQRLGLGWREHDGRRVEGQMGEESAGIPLLMGFGIGTSTVVVGLVARELP